VLDDVAMERQTREIIVRGPDKLRDELHSHGASSTEAACGLGNGIGLQGG